MTAEIRSVQSMTLHEMSISAIQKALGTGELSAGEIARQTLDAITASTRSSTRGRRSPPSECWQKPRISTPCAGKSALCRWRAFPAVKNLFDVAGHTTLAGAELFSQRPAAADSFAVRQLRSAGGLLSGMVNMDAYAYGFTTENSHYGATHNPHDLKRIAGVSSGDQLPPSPPGWSIFRSALTPTARFAYRPPCAGYMA
jgi:aspartyl-tRNA(Asn)/glutamyl-tRNA(Gln) amidotransferase subunit A